VKVTTDIDIDVLDRDKVLTNLKHITARINREDGYVKHNTGVYFQDIPYDPVTGLATIDYKRAEELGYMKIDFLNNSVYKGVRSEEHLDQLVNAEPMWEMLDDKEVVARLFHIGQHADLVTRLKPRSVKQLAMLLAIIRPGKAHLQNRTWPEIEKEVWVKPEDDSYYFKKSHAHGYALAIVVQMNLMVEIALLG
jgi:DNA polymerase III alpha subunit